MKNKHKSIIVIILFLLAGSSVWLINRTVYYLRIKQENEFKRQHSMPFKMHNLLGLQKKYDSDVKSVILVLFNSDCEHCQYQADQLHKHTRLLQIARVWLLSTESEQQLLDFTKRYHLDTLPNVTVLQVEPHIAHDSLGLRTVPHFLIYGSDGKLRKEFRGETRWETVEKAL